MFRLYLRGESGSLIAYHEVWAEPRRRRLIEHWGELGEAGQTRVHGINLFRSLETQIERLLERVREAGFVEIEPEDQKGIAVTYDISRLSREDDLIKQQAVADRLTEILGWTGLGECEEAESNEGVLTAKCWVVDTDLAVSVIQEGLEDSDISDFQQILKLS